MSKVLVLAAIAAWWAAGLDAGNANAQGFHFQTRGLHFDVGNPHRGYYHSAGYRHWNRQPWGGYHGGSWDRDHVWHDTTHLDWHPGEHVRHYNHYHYVPGHWDVHYDGHWDHLHH